MSGGNIRKQQATWKLRIQTLGARPLIGGAISVERAFGYPFTPDALCRNQ